MCSKMFKKMFSGRQERIATIEAAAKQTAADEALRQALRPVQDNEDARKAQDAAMRRLMGRKGARSAMTGAGRGDQPSVSYKVLMGA